MTRWLVFSAWLCCSLTGQAALNLDDGFGSSGLVVHELDGPTDEGVVAMRVDGQDRIVSVYAGSNSAGVSRHLADGSLDASFGSGGIMALDFHVRDLALQADGRIVVVGVSARPYFEQDWRIARLMPDGSLDSGFGDGGQVTMDWYGSSDEAISVALDASGQIVVGGRAYSEYGTAFAVAIFDSQGERVSEQAHKLFSDTADTCNQVLVQPDGNILCAGVVKDYGGALMAVLRYLPDLTLDTGFGTDGLATVIYPEGPAEAMVARLLPGGEILLGGLVDDADDYALALARLTAGGSLDASFAGDGRAMLHLPGLEEELIDDLHVDGGRILAVARANEGSNSNFLVVGFTSSGLPDTDWGSAGLVEVDFNGDNDLPAAIVGHQGRLLVGGEARAALQSHVSDLAFARLMPNGTLDTGFAQGGLAQSGFEGPGRASTYAAAVLDDGRLVTAGQLGISFSSMDFVVTAFNSDGSVDMAFGEGGRRRLDFDNDEDVARSVLPLPGGDLVVAGTVDTQAGGYDFGIAKFLSDGSLDTGFGDQGRVILDFDGYADYAWDLALQPDGKIVVAGDAGLLVEGRRFALVRLNPDGSLDSGFGTGGIAHHGGISLDQARAMALLADGRIVLTGSGDGTFVFMCFNPNGSLDASFGSGGIAQIDFAGERNSPFDMIVVPDWQGQGERIVAVGTAQSGSSSSSKDFAAAMLATDGTLEPGFGGSGEVMVDLGGVDQALGVAAMPGGLVLAGRSGTADFTALAIGFDGVPAAGFFSSGDTFIQDFGGNNDGATVAVADGSRLVLAGYSFDNTGSSVSKPQSIALARLAASTRIFSDRFELP